MDHFKGCRPPAFKAIVRSKDPGCDMFDEIVVDEPNEP